MKARLFSLFILLACMLIQAQEQAQAQTKAQAQTQSQPQQSFPYPALPDTLRSVEQRAGYLSEHYWDNYNFADTLMLKSEEVTEQGFVNFIDILGRFNPAIAQKGIAGFPKGFHKCCRQGKIRESDRALFRESPVAPAQRQSLPALPGRNEEFTLFRRGGKGTSCLQNQDYQQELAWRYRHQLQLQRRKRKVPSVERLQRPEGNPLLLRPRLRELSQGFSMAQAANHPCRHQGTENHCRQPYQPHL